MDGQSISKGINKDDKRVIATDRELWQSILGLSKIYQNVFPFSASEVVRNAGKGSSNSILTRERGGLQQFVDESKKLFSQELNTLVEKEKTKSGNLNLKFCRNLAFLISKHSHLFALDIITDSHHNTKLLLETVKFLMDEKRFIYFAANFYQLLVDWHANNFDRKLIFNRYEKQLESLFTNYQMKRPDMAVTTRSIFKDESLLKKDNSKKEGGYD